MNLALGAIFLAILLIPPLLFHFFYRSNRHARAAAKFSLLEYFLLSSVISLSIHAFAIKKFHLKVDYRFIGNLLSGKIDENIPLETLELYYTQFSLYIISLCLATSLLGFLLGRLMTWRRLRMLPVTQWLRNNRFPWSYNRYFNHWWHFFRINEYNNQFHTQNSEHQDKEPLIRIEAFTKLEGLTVLYSGFLIDFVTEGEALDRIYLSGASKRIISLKETEKESLSGKEKISEIYKLKDGPEEIIMPTGLLCLPYANIINMLVRFVSITSLELEENTTKNNLNASSLQDIVSDQQTEIISD